MKRLAVVIGNYQKADSEIDCLKSLEAQLEPRRDVVIVVDNGSDEGSAAPIEQAVEQNGSESWTMLVLSDKNGGRSAGMNAGIRSVDAESLE